MPPHHDEQYLTELVNSLRRLPRETEWLEFKVNPATEPERIGECISALANSAALCGKDAAYLLWGVADDGHAVVGTDFRPETATHGSEPLEEWLRRRLTPSIDFRFQRARYDGKSVVILTIAPPRRQPAAFAHERYIRIGSVKADLREHPDKERALWQIFNSFAFESQIARAGLSGDETLKLLRHDAYFSLQDAAPPQSADAILRALEQDHLIVAADTGKWNVTNLGAVTLANRLQEFGLQRKAPRVVIYRGAGRAAAIREKEGTMGYGVGFANLIRLINRWTTAETVRSGLRRAKPMIPEAAVRELVANALIHQDFTVAGAGPMIEIFDARIEITSPGPPLADPKRFPDATTGSRNERTAALLRRCGIGAARGAGIAKAAAAIEAERLPAPWFENLGNGTRATLFAAQDFDDPNYPDPINACRLHVGLRHRQGLPANRESLRLRFGLPESQSELAAELLRAAAQTGLIAPQPQPDDADNPNYLPSRTA